MRHEAGEALGAIGTPECIEHLRRHQNDGCLEARLSAQQLLLHILSTCSLPMYAVLSAGCSDVPIGFAAHRLLQQ